MLRTLFQRPALLIGLSLFPVMINGCVVKDIGTTVEHSFKGDYYLSTEKYEQGRQSFAQEVADNPDSAWPTIITGDFCWRMKIISWRSCT